MNNYQSPVDSFSSFNLSDAMLIALERKGFSIPTPIQGIALPRLLADEGHLIVKARTGTGKTAAFGIPLVERLTSGGHAPRAIVLTPTRELALQVAREIASLVPRREGAGGLFPRVTAVYGGASIRNQIIDLKRGTEIVVGTPGRVIDFMERKVLDLSGVDWFILDEADEMLDMGFFEDVEKILGHIKGGAHFSGGALPGGAAPSAETSADEPAAADEPAEADETVAADLPAEGFQAGTGKNPRAPRIALFSATMPDAILKVIREHIGNAEILEDPKPADEKPLVDQFYMILKKEDRLEALRRVIDQAADFYGLVFCATKVETDELARRLVEGGYPAEAIHGDLSQEARERTLRRFRSRQTTVLVATDVAARGLDIERLTHVVNWDLPNDRESYVHRIGRTGRAGQRGRAISLALPGDRRRLDHFSRSMEKILGSAIQWTKVPSVKSVMKAIKARIRSSVLAAAEAAGVRNEDAPEADTAPQAVFPDELPAISAGGETPPAEIPAEQISAEQISPENVPLEVSPVVAQLSRELIEKIGAEEAVTILLSMAYGEQLDSSRYGAVMEIPEPQAHDERIRPGLKGAFKRGGRARARYDFSDRFDSRGGHSAGKDSGETRVYVGLGRRHGAGARDVAALLGRAGGVPGRLVDAIEMKDYCAFASLPSDAARRACAFSKNTPKDPAIRLASPKDAR